MTRLCAMASRVPRRRALAALVASVAFLAYRSIPFVAPTQEHPGRGSLVPKSSMVQPMPSTVEVDAIADGRIFVSIAAYADPELPSTMMSLLNAAERPELIHFGIVWQGPGSGFAAEDLSQLAKLWNADDVNERFVTDMQLPHGSRVPWKFLTVRGCRRFTGSVSAKKWQCDGWQEKIHGRSLVYFGERHEQAAILDAQVSMLEYWSQTVRTPALVLEMFTQDQQFILDRWNSEVPDVLQQLYLDSGGDFELSHYIPLLDAATAAGVRLVAGFPTREAARRIIQDPASEEVSQMALLHHQLGPAIEDHFRLFAALIAGEAPMEEGPLPQRGRRIFPAQCWKDLECAKVVASLLPSHSSMVVTGCGHTDFALGIPCRVRALAAVPVADEVIVTCREQGEVVTWTFRTHSLADLLDMLDGRVRSIRMPAEDARGPCWARYLAQLLWEKEELQLQLDSHMRFVPGWDTKARAELKFCSQNSEKPILCSYGAGYSLGTPYWETPKGSSQTSVNCANTFDSDGILLIKARELKAPLDEPRKHYFWGAQFSFSSADVLCEVPYDPQLQMLFFGEEILMAVRFFTHGWDVFTPKEQLFFHLWERDYRRVYWKDNRELFASLLKESQCRVVSQLETGQAAAGTETWPLPGGGVSNPEKDHFSLGTRRTLEDYQVSWEEFRAKFRSERWVESPKYACFFWDRFAIFVAH
eukprot:s3216_g8.t2